MLILRNIIITLLLLELLVICVVGLMVEMPPVLHWTPDRVNDIGRSVVTIMRPGLALFFTWLLTFLGTLLVFFITVARPRRRMKIEVQMGGGRVVIMDAAIKRYVRSALAEIDDVNVKKITLREQRGQVTTDIYADVKTKQNLPTLERRIISRVRAALAEDLGITNLGDVHVFIKNFEVTGRPITPAPEPAEQPDETFAKISEEPVANSNISESGLDVRDNFDETGNSDAANQPIRFPQNETAAAVTEVPESEEVILAEKPLPGQDNLQTDHDNIDVTPEPSDSDEDEPLPWDTIRNLGMEKDEDERKEPPTP